MFIVSRSVFIADGLSFRANPPGQIHLLDLNQLGANPFLAFTDLHIQPPLFNFFVGAVIRWSPFPAGISFQVLYLSAGLATVLMLWSLLRNLAAKPWIATAATVLVTLDPLLIRDESTLTYETLVALIIVATVWSADRYFRRGRLGRFSLLLGVLVVGVLTRTTLNPLWFVTAVILVLVLRPPRIRRVAAAVVAAVALACVAAPIVHNEIRFDTVGLSSFSGMNLERITVLQLPRHRLDELIREEKISPAAAVVPYAYYEKFAPFYPPCSPDTGIAVLDEFTKAGNDAPNLNNVCYLPVYRQGLRDSASVIRNDPGVYARAVGVSTLLYAGWDTRFSEPSSELWHDWSAIYEPIALPVHLGYTYGSGDPQTYTAVLGSWTRLVPFSVTIALALVLVLVRGVAGVVSLLRRRGDDSTRTLVFVGYLVLAVTLVSVTVDTFENARFRAPLDPLLLGMLAVFVAEGIDRWVTRRSTRSAGVTATADSDDADGGA